MMDDGRMNTRLIRKLIGLEENTLLAESREMAGWMDGETDEGATRFLRDSP